MQTTTFLKTVVAVHSVRISNDLYVSDVISAYEAAKGDTLPINPHTRPVPVDTELLEAHANVLDRRNLTRRLLSHFLAGDMVQVYVKSGKNGKLVVTPPSHHR